MQENSDKSNHEQLEFDFGKPPQPSPLSHEALLTIVEACRLFNLKAHVLRRAINVGSIPSYRLGNGRIRLRASDISRAIEASRSGGAK
jgi:excisionase family DNA binding protein